MAVGVVGVWRGVGTMRRTYQDARCHWCGGCRWGLVAVPVGGGGAWPGFEATRRAELAARTASGRAAAHRHTKQPGPTARYDGAPNRSSARKTRWPRSKARIQAERPASSVARWTPPRPASCAAWVRHEKPSARYTASGFADRDGSSEWDATATDRS